MIDEDIAMASSHVLVVDDDFATRLLYHEALEPAGFSVSEAENGAIALKQYQSRKPDIILLDVIMPKMNGFETCESLKKLPDWSDTPIVMVTGLDDFASIEQANELGATDFITKPINWPILKHRLNFILKANHAFRELKDKQIQLNNAQRIARIGSWEWDVIKQHGTYSPECLNICNLSNEEAERLTLRQLFDLVHPEDRVQVEEAFAEAWQLSNNFSVENRVIAKNGAIKHLRCSAELIKSKNNITKITGTIQDITDRVEAEERIRHLAYYDGLTGLPNRQLFREHLKLAIKQAYRENHSIYILFLDMDNFKHVNDSLGHDAGDQLLKDFTKRLQNVTRETDYAAREVADNLHTIDMSRLGGDEFTILLKDISDIRAASVIAKRIINSMTRPFIISDQELFVSTSIGISVFPEDGGDEETLIKHADVAMYHAKSRGKNNYQFFNAQMNTAALNRLSQENALRRAISQDEFILHYQPRVEITSGRIVGVEALIRWQHPENGFTLPGEFIPLAEESRLIIPIGEWVIKAACQQIKAWQVNSAITIPVSVNISPYQFSEGKLHTTITNIINDTGIDPALLELEITESALMNNIEQTVQLMRLFRDIGVRLAIDDFGTGYSVLNTLRLFPLDVLKIDQSFIQNLPADKTCQVIAEAIIHMAKGLALDVVAEGVETQQQFDCLKKHNHIHVQGYFFSKPISPEQLIELIISRNITPSS